MRQLAEPIAGTHHSQSELAEHTLWTCPAHDAWHTLFCVFHVQPALAALATHEAWSG